MGPFPKDSACVITATILAVLILSIYFLAPMPTMLRIVTKRVGDVGRLSLPTRIALMVMSTKFGMVVDIVDSA